MDRKRAKLGQYWKTMAKDIRISFSVITPTIGRDTLRKTMDSIEGNRSDQIVEHIIIADGAEAWGRLQAMYILTESTEQTKSSGNHQRLMGNLISQNTYTLYIDDDDWYINNTFDELARLLKEANYPDVAVFPALRQGHIFFNKPAGSCRTVSCQWVHKTVIETPDGPFRPMWYTPKPGHHYTADGVFLDQMIKDFGVTYLESEKPLVQVDYISRGAIVPTK